MIRSSGRALCGILIAGGLAGTAIAATPESGSVSSTAPKITWTGETIGGYFTRMPTAVTDSTDTPCEAPSCDTFTLTVQDSANLTIAETLDSESETAAFTMRITQPDGTIVQTDAEPGAASGGKYVKVLIKNAPIGEYTIHHYDNAADSMSYQAYAELAVPAAAPPAPAPAPNPGTNQPPAPQPTQVQAIALRVKAGKASARKLARTRSLPVRIGVSRPVSSVTAALMAGKKVVGKGKLGAIKRSGTLKLKLSKKLKKGTYALKVVASDGGTSTQKIVKVKVAK